MRTLLCVCVSAALAFANASLAIYFCGDQSVLFLNVALPLKAENLQSDMVSVPLLSGGEISIPRADAHKISPIGWAMMLDRDRNKQETWELFDEACKKNPSLFGKVGDLYASKGRLERVERRIRVRR